MLVLVAALLALLLCVAADASHPGRAGHDARAVSSSSVARPGASSGGHGRLGAPLNDTFARTVNIERRDTGGERSHPHRVLGAALVAAALCLLVLVCHGPVRARRVPRPAPRRSRPACGRAPPRLLPSPL